MWKTKSLKDLCNIFTDGDWIEKKDQSVDGIRLVQTGNIKVGYFAERQDKARYISEDTFNRLNCTEVKRGDILVSRLPDPVGRASIIPELKDKAITAVDCTIIRLKEEILPTYLNYYMQSPQYLSSIQLKVTGATRQRISRKNLGEISITFPPLAEQQRIVAKLDAAFAEIHEAVENINLKETKLDNLKSVIISDSFRDNGWDNKKLGDCVSYEKKNAKGSSLPYVGMENITPETMNLIGEVAIPESTSSSFHFNKSHVLFGRLRPYLRKVLVPDFTGQCSTEIFCIKPEDNVIREFLAYWLLEQKISSKIEATSTGARMPRANMNALLEFDFPIPSIKEQKKITSKLDLTFAKISKAKNTLAKSKYNYFCLKSAILSQELQSSEAA